MKIVFAAKIDFRNTDPQELILLIYVKLGFGKIDFATKTVFLYCFIEVGSSELFVCTLGVIVRNYNGI